MLHCQQSCPRWISCARLKCLSGIRFGSYKLLVVHRHPSAGSLGGISYVSNGCRMLCFCVCVCVRACVRACVCLPIAKLSGHLPGNWKVLGPAWVTLMLLLFPWARNFAHIAPVYPGVKILRGPGINLGSSPPSYNMNGYLVYTGEANVKPPSLFC